ncbi:uncharacterized protein LOC141965310 isoform X2 [Athene noctua]|uniref:uncharacterized protein LOC141965310 isoform X2 n=1 Tax=Athene noctua TaxID=126797 RepID=UPI003EBCA232
MVSRPDPAGGSAVAAAAQESWWLSRSCAKSCAHPRAQGERKSVAPPGSRLLFTCLNLPDQALVPDGKETHKGQPPWWAPRVETPAALAEPRLLKSRLCPQPFPRGGRPVGPFVPGSRTGCGGTLDVLKDYDSAVAALAVLYHVWQRSHILPSRLLHTQPSGLHFPADPSSWMTELFGTCRVSLPGCPSTLHLGHKIHPCSSRVRGL